MRHARSKVEPRERVKKKKTKRRVKISPAKCDYDKRIKMSERLREEDVTRKAQLKDIANFMNTVLPAKNAQTHNKF